MDIFEIARKIDIKKDEIIPWGAYKAKISLDIFKRISNRPNGKLILVTTINPTFEGEGKTTITIGLAQALALLKKKVCLAIREPSIGPVMGIKGGGTGGGRCQVQPAEDINLHFTGDMHAISSAHNLLSALLDNHLFHGDAFHIDPRYIVWPRVIDMSDRNLRNVVVGLGGPKDGVPHQDRFSITAASEIMACLCLSQSMEELKKRFEKIIVAYSYDEKPVTAKQLRAVGAMAALLKDAIKPNLVQTTEGVPAFVHGGPFANIAHGTSSILTAKLGLKLTNYFVIEAGFGTDLGAEKFCNIVCRHGLRPDVAVLVVSIRALKWHGGMSSEDLKQGKKNMRALKKGLENLEKHIENMNLFGLPVVLALNRFPLDCNDEIDIVEKHFKNLPFAVADVYEQGGEGGIELAGKVVETLYKQKTAFQFLYDLNLPLKEKIEVISRQIYGAGKVVYSITAEDDIRIIDKIQLSQLPVCMAKTPYSLTDDSTIRGRPKNFKITIKEIRISAGAGFLVPITGKITTMPGLPAKPAAERIDIYENDIISGIV